MLGGHLVLNKIHHFTQFSSTSIANRRKHHVVPVPLQGYIYTEMTVPTASFREETRRSLTHAHACDTTLSKHLAPSVPSGLTRAAAAPRAPVLTDDAEHGAGGSHVQGCVGHTCVRPAVAVPHIGYLQMVFVNGKPAEKTRSEQLKRTPSHTRGMAALPV